MRHPPRLPRSAVGAAAPAFVGIAVAPVGTASGAAPACTVEYSVTSQWDAGFQGAVKYSIDLSQWLTYKPTDPAGNLAAAWHVYNFNSCSNESCWDDTLAPVAAQVPLVAGEIGENSRAHSFIDRVMKWSTTGTSPSSAGPGAPGTATPGRP